MPNLETALQQFEASEANLAKLEKIWAELEALISTGPAFGAPPKYDDLCRAFRGILLYLPSIDGFRVEDKLWDYDDIGQNRLDALELGEIQAEIAIDREIAEQGRQLREYRFRFDGKRAHLIRQRVLDLIDMVDSALRKLVPRYESHEVNKEVGGPDWEQVKDAIAEIDTLLGSSVQRPACWRDLHRHLSFHKVVDLLDIEKHDWPPVKKAFRSVLYGEHDPLPVEVVDLGQLVAQKPTGSVPTKLNWSILSAEDFERLVFLIISDTSGYENAEWLQQTNAPDRGRDLSVYRVFHDPLLSTHRQRVIIQCKHWLAKSVAAPDLTAAIGQMELWQPPRVDALIVATTGRFTADAVALAEKQNLSDRALNVELWPENHLERLLASRPHLIAEFSLRRPA